jgi:hypothetical protein
MLFFLCSIKNEHNEQIWLFLCEKIAWKICLFLKEKEEGTAVNNHLKKLKRDGILLKIFRYSFLWSAKPVGPSFFFYLFYKFIFNYLFYLHKMLLIFIYILWNVNLNKICYLFLLKIIIFLFDLFFFFVLISQKYENKNHYWLNINWKKSFNFKIRVSYIHNII